MSGRPISLPPGLSGRPFTVAEAAQVGIARSRLRAGDLERPFAGVRVSRGAIDGAAAAASAYAVKLAPGEFFSHATAGVLHGMWLPLELERDTAVDVSVRKPQRAPRDRAVRGHHLIDRPGLVTHLRGMAVASTTETWCQLATILHIPDLVAAGDSLLSPGRLDAIAQLDRLVWAAADEDRPMHVRLLRAAALIRPGVRSAKETALRLLVVADGLPEPEVNGEILDARGLHLAECDLVFWKQRVVLEYEGDYHRTDVGKFRSDISRYDRLQDLGWRVIRVTEADLRRPKELLARIRRALNRSV